MPSRLLREGILDSEAVNALSFQAEVFYRRLMSVVDDFGRFDGRPTVLRSRLYPLRVDTVREADISRWTAECVKAGLIALYAVNRAGSPRWIATCEKAGLSAPGDERPYILFHRLGSPRAKESKFPAPPDDGGPAPAPAGGPERPNEDAIASAQMKTDENGCAQVKTDVPGSGSGSGSGTSSGSPAGPAGEGDKPARKAERKPRPPDPLFDAIADVTGTDPRASAGFVAKVRHALAGADPPYTPAEVRAFGEPRFLAARLRWAEGRRPTLGEVEKYIGLVRNSPLSPGAGLRVRGAAIDAGAARDLGFF